MCVCVRFAFVCAILMRRHFIGVLCCAFARHVYAACAPLPSMLSLSVSPTSIHLSAGFSQILFHFTVFHGLLFSLFLCLSVSLLFCLFRLPMLAASRRLVSLSSFLLVFSCPLFLSLSLALNPNAVSLSVCIQNLLIPHTRSCFQVENPPVPQPIPASSPPPSPLSHIAHD